MVEIHQLVRIHLFQTKNSSLEKNLNRALNKILKRNINKNVLFSSVVPNVFKKINKIFKKKNYNTFEIKKFNLKKIMKFKVKKYSQLVSDRIANALGAYDKFKTSCIIIDFGTATTFDVVKKGGIYDGGIIAHGINLSIEN